MYTRDAWLVVVEVEDVDWEPWLLLSGHPVEDEAGALRIFRMYRSRSRGAVEDCFKFTMRSGFSKPFTSAAEKAMFIALKSNFTIEVQRSEF